MLFVMFIHSPVDGDAKSSPAIFLLKGYFASGAVPIFFLLSGYLGAKTLQTPTLRFSAFARNKLRTLIIPFLFWNLFVLILVFSAKSSGLASGFRGSGAYFDVEFSLSSIACATFGIGRPPIVYQFWFLRDLIVVSFAAFILRRALPKIPLLPWFFFFIPIPMASSLGYYLLGHHLHGILPTEKFPKVDSSLIFCLCWFGMGIGVLVGWVNIPYPIQQVGSASFILMIAISLAATRLRHKVALLGPATFFVYATHEPLQTIIAKVWQALNIPHYGTLFCFLLIPASVYLISVVGYFFLCKITPQLMSVATGNREWPNKAVDSTATRVTPPASSLRSGQESRHGQP
jgi:fucose 4-O-acetylase-like acetyltransferase